MRELRIVFEKKGDMVFCSHLDLVRYFTRAMNRADIPVHFTEGFTKKPRLRFSPPLSLGYTGLGELLDIGLEGDMSELELKNRLNGAMCPDCHIRSVAAPRGRLPDIVWSLWRLELPLTAEEAKAALQPLAGETLIVTKRSKSGERELDILPLIGARRLAGSSGTAVLEVMIDVNLNPKYLLNACGIEPQSVRITRLGFLDRDAQPFA